MFVIRAGHREQSVLVQLGTGPGEEEMRDNIQLTFLEVDITINASLSLGNI